MSSSRRARRLRRHEKYGKPSYPSLPKNGLTPTAVTTDEWIGPYLDGEREHPRVITSEMIDWGRSYISYDNGVTKIEKEEGTGNFRTNLFIE